MTQYLVMYDEQGNPNMVIRVPSSRKAAQIQAAMPGLQTVSQAEYRKAQRWLRDHDGMATESEAGDDT